MEKLFGKLSLSAACDAGDERDDLVATMNQVVNPPTPLAADDVYLGALYAASDQINLQGGCFAQSELEQLAELVIGAPILVGHQKQYLPIGRAFKAEIVTRDDQPWLKVYFYWSRKQAGADELKAGIDAGIYSECSLAFQYGKPECAVCRADMRRCRHRIGQPVQLGGREIKAFYYYKELARVLEISLVYRGAVEGTKVESLADATGRRQMRASAAHDDTGPAARCTKIESLAAVSRDGQVWTPAAHDAEQFDPFWRNQARPVFSLIDLETPLGELIAEPLYNGLWCLLDYRDGELQSTTPDGGSHDLPILSRVSEQVKAGSFQMLAQVYPVKGGSRLPLGDLLSGRTDKVKVALFDLYEIDGHNLRELALGERKEILQAHLTRTHEIFPAPYQKVSPLELEKLPGAATNLGLILSVANQSAALVSEYRVQPLLRIRFDNSEEHKVQGIPTNLEPGNAIWVRRSGDGILKFVDLCQPGLRLDDIGLLNVAADKRPTGHFHLLRDQSGDCWLSLSLGNERVLLRIRKLNLD
ncbi:MAG: hypothetical protein ABIJ61_14985, partial [bacterium]